MNKVYVRNLNDPVSIGQRVIKSLSNLRASLNTKRKIFILPTLKCKGGRLGTYGIFYICDQPL